jgi:TPR repeat protein
MAEKKLNKIKKNEGERKEDKDDTTEPKIEKKEEKGEECCICLEELPRHAAQFTRMVCCGNGMHKHCTTDLKSMKMNGTCPLCRTKTPTSHEEEIKQLHPWVKKKKAWAQCHMGQYYRDGNGVKQSYEMTRILYEQAAQQGDVGSMYNLGVLYEHGEGVEVSYEKAKEYYEQAAHLGFADAQFNLGTMYDKGEGVEQSYERAKEYYEQAAQLGNAKAQFYLGRMYCNGLGVERDLKKAKELWTQAASQGNQLAIDELEKLKEWEAKTKTSSASNDIVCSFCNTPQTESCKLIRCPCHIVQYCNKSCQKQHRKKHKKECRRLLSEKKLKKTK